MTGPRWSTSSSAVIALLLAGCTCEHPPPRPLTRGLLDLAGAARDEGLVQALPDQPRTLERLSRLVRQARAELPGRHPVEALNRAVFRRRGFRREVQDLSLSSVLLPRVLERRRGSCMGLAALYLALGEALELPLAPVLVPGHLFVRYQGPAGQRDAELLKQGRQMPLGWYRTKYAVPADNPLYLQRTLTVPETLAVYRYNLANELRDRGRLRGALEHYRRVVAVLPGFAEAQANLGLTLQRLGRRDAARQAYQRARAANPGLTGLEHNLRQLR